MTGQVRGKEACPVVEKLNAPICRSEIANVNLTRRIRHLKDVVDYIDSNRAELTNALVRDNLTPRKTARKEIAVSRNFLKEFIASRELNPSFPGPLGIFFVILPFDFPTLLMSLHVLALYALGNTVAVKPSRQTSRTALFYKRMFAELGIEEIAVVTHEAPRKFMRLAYECSSARFCRGSGAVRGTGLIFSGTERVWQTVERKSEHFDLVAYHGPGNSAAYVDHSVRDVGNVARLMAHAAFANSGQYCFSIKTVVVHRDVYPDFVNALLQALDELKLGDPCDEETDVGPVRNDYVRRLWKRIVAERKGGVLYGGSYSIVHHPELDEMVLLKPTVIEAEEIPQTEVFGPLMFLVQAEGFEDGLRKVRDNPFGLYASFFGDFARSEYTEIRALEGRHYGVVDVNRWVDNPVSAAGEVSRAEMPHLREGWGGVKKSGLLIDRRGGRVAVLQGRYRPEHIAFSSPLDRTEGRYYRAALSARMTTTTV